MSGLSAVTTSIGKEDQVMQMWMKRRYELQTAQGSQEHPARVASADLR
jgi:hypothetical protein